MSFVTYDNSDWLENRDGWGHEMVGKSMDGNEVNSKILMAKKVDGSHEPQRLVEINHLTHTNHPLHAKHQELPKHIKVSEENAIALNSLTLSVQHFHHISQCNFIQMSEEKKFKQDNSRFLKSRTPSMLRVHHIYVLPKDR